ncbi:MAG: M23 family metallopeptidase [Clostridia bacterium]|nr:M23 family metallopeptidase [Clostridia bacterium]
MLKICSIIIMPAYIKRRVNFILKSRILYYFKRSFKLITLLIIAAAIVTCIVLIKYKPVYKVTFFGEEVGYITSKNGFEKVIEEDILTSKELNVAYITLDSLPSYEFKLIDKACNTNEQEILDKIAKSSETTYKMYAITLDGNNQSYVNTMEEAEEVVAKIKEDNSKTDLKLGITEIYTTNLEELNTVKVADAESTITNTVNEAEKQKQAQKKQEQEKSNKTFNGVYFSVKPVTGTITSRFGSKESIRKSAHKGIDIGAPNGTPIYAAADGTVTYASYNSGGYGNLVIISHGNGIETYYGHCSKLYVKKGQKVSAGDNIAAVGSTGRSTGNHLHFEIRQNGSQINPQRYVYN